MLARALATAIAIELVLVMAYYEKCRLDLKTQQAWLDEFPEG